MQTVRRQQIDAVIEDVVAAERAGANLERIKA